MGGRTSLNTLAEWLIFVSVVLATVSLNVTPTVEVSEEMEVSKLTGTMILSTRSSMDLLGLEEFERGAEATINMEVRSVVNEGCADCTSPPTGIEINGNVNLTKIFDSGGKSGRVEATMNIVHLKEYQDDDFITREWMSINWLAGDEEKNWDLYVFHDPPKWELDRYQSAFIEIEGGEESRTGPWMFIQTLVDNSVNVRGCLPDSPTCTSTTPSDINLKSELIPKRTPVTINHTISWNSVEFSGTSEELPSKMQDIRNQMDLGEQVSVAKYWCPSDVGDLDSVVSWEIEEVNPGVIAPMGIWLDALLISNPTFNLNGEFWIEAESDGQACAAIVDSNQNVTLGLHIS